MIKFRSIFTITLIVMLALCKQVALADKPIKECSREYYDLMDELTDKINLIEAERQKLAFKPKLINDPNIDVRLTYKDGRKMRYLEAQVKKLNKKNLKLLETISETNAQDLNHEEELEDSDSLSTIKDDNTKSLTKQIKFLEEENKRLRDSIGKQTQNTAPITMNGMICKPIKK